MTPKDTAQSVRVSRAADRVVAATRTARLARIAAADDLRARARRRSRMFRYGMVLAVVVAVALAITTIVYATLDHRADDRAAGNDAVLDAAGSAVTTMLSADPAHAEAYVNAVLAVSAGPQRDRVERSAGALAAAVAAQPVASTGRVITSGLITDPASDDAGTRAEVLLVAQASDPQLVGGDPDADRITLRLTMIRDADGWLVDSAVVA